MSGLCPRCWTEGILAPEHQHDQSRYFWCPIANRAVILGVTAIRLTRPCRLVLVSARPHTACLRTRHTRPRPTAFERDTLDRVGHRVLGAGCVVGSEFDPARADHTARLRLVPVRWPGDPTEWLINRPLPVPGQTTTSEHVWWARLSRRDIAGGLTGS
ncbi:hypothetical protein [Nocardia altamirensis]|uniref:hypothetical protein n=1 Tax=Nocardia altamirensis TaxID=472158 RepID=UPI00084089B9|nr:hypothetical protein [Nocardia altamirensis]